MYKLIHVSGPDAVAFLQGQLTQDIARITAGTCLPAAWCNAQGRVIMTLRVAAAGAGLVLVVPADSADAAMARLTMYRLRAKVKFEPDVPGWQFFAVMQDSIGADAMPPAIAMTKLQSTEPVVEILADKQSIGTRKLAEANRLDDRSWQVARIRAGQADISTGNTGLYTPHMLNLDLAGAVSFEKGCYTGQEIVARTEHRGASKRRSFRYTCELPDLAIGDVLLDDGKEAGTVVNAAGNELLAVIPVSLAGRPLAIRGAKAAPAALPYAIPG